MQKCQPFSLYSPLFTYPAPYIGFESYYTFKYNRSSLVLINSWNRNSNSVCHSINSRCRHVNSRCYNANSRCNDDNSRTKWSVYKYIYMYIDLYNVSERYTESSLSCMRKRARTLYINKVPLWNVFGTAFIDAAMQFSFSKIFTDTPVLPL